MVGFISMMQKIWQIAIRRVDTLHRHFCKTLVSKSQAK